MPLTMALFLMSSRLVGFPRVALRTSNQFQLDLRVVKYFQIGEPGKLDFVVESFSHLNHTNIIGLNQFFGPGPVPIPRFNTPGRAGMARQLQFSIDFDVDDGRKRQLSIRGHG